MTYTHGQIEGCSLYWKMLGRTYEIKAIREGQTATNELLRLDPSLGVLQVIGSWVILIDNGDQGVAFSRKLKRNTP